MEEYYGDPRTVICMSDRAKDKRSKRVAQRHIKEWDLINALEVLSALKVLKEQVAAADCGC